MKTYFNIILIIILPLFMFQCEFLEEFEKGNGEIVTERRSVDDFNELRIGGNFEVILEESNSMYVQINTDENLLFLIWRTNMALMTGPQDVVSIEVSAEGLPKSVTTG